MDGVERYYAGNIDKDRLVILEKDFDAALAREAALREELATAKRNEHNSEVAYKAAIEKQEELREELAEIKESLAYRGSLLNRTQQRAEAAEQRNAVMSKLLQRCIPVCRYKGSHTERALINEIETALTKPTESGARHTATRIDQ